MGGKSTSSTEMPAWAQQASQDAIRMSRELGKVGYMPYYGPDIAAFSPMQELGMQSSYDAAAAYGLAPQGGNAMAGMPQAQEFAGGVRGYSSGDLYEQARAEFEAKNPVQAAQYNKMFVPSGIPEEGSGYQGYQGYQIPYIDSQGNQQYYNMPVGMLPPNFSYNIF